MVSALDDFIEDMLVASNPDKIWQRTAEFGYDLGFQSCSLTMAEGDPGQVASVTLKTDMPEEFCDGYMELGLIDIDPFLHFTCRGLKPSRIVTGNLSSFPGAEPSNRRMLDLVETLGFSNGYGIPVRTKDQGIYGGWVFSTNHSHDNFEKLEAEHGSLIHLATVLAYERMIALGLSQASREPLLSGRERECLLWLCAGLRVSKIAAKLSISESAVNLYITNAKHKLGAKTREQAIARAIFSGEIEQ